MLNYGQNHSTVQIWDLKPLKSQKNQILNFEKKAENGPKTDSNVLKVDKMAQNSSEMAQEHVKMEGDGQEVVKEAVNMTKLCQLKNLREHRGFICQARFSPLNPLQVIVSSEDHSVKVWNYMESEFTGPPNKRKKKKSNKKSGKNAILNELKFGGDVKIES